MRSKLNHDTRGSSREGVGLYGERTIRNRIAGRICCDVWRVGCDRKGFGLGLEAQALDWGWGPGLGLRGYTGHDGRLVQHDEGRH